jgi:hypothetical protein
MKPEDGFQLYDVTAIYVRSYGLNSHMRVIIGVEANGAGMGTQTAM